MDSTGLLRAVVVTAADGDDAAAAAMVFDRLDGQPMSHVGRMCADSKYHNHALYAWVGEHARFVAEVPVNFAVREAAGGPARRADARPSAADARRGARHRLAHRAVRPSDGRAVTAAVWVAGREHTLVAAADEGTGGVKYFPTNATTEALSRVLAVAFRRWAVEHAFRLGKREAGRMDYEGRNYTGLLRHLTLAVIVPGFVTAHTGRRRGEKPARDGGAGVPGAEPAELGPVPPASGYDGHSAYQRRHPVPPEEEQDRRQVPQEAAA